MTRYGKGGQGPSTVMTKVLSEVLVRQTPAVQKKITAGSPAVGSFDVQIKLNGVRMDPDKFFRDMEEGWDEMVDDQAKVLLGEAIERAEAEALQRIATTITQLLAERGVPQDPDYPREETTWQRHRSSHSS